MLGMAASTIDMNIRTRTLRSQGRFSCTPWIRRALPSDAWWSTRKSNQETGSMLNASVTAKTAPPRTTQEFDDFPHSRPSTAVGRDGLDNVSQATLRASSNLDGGFLFAPTSSTIARELDH